MKELKITDEAVRRAAEKCSTAKSVLTELFPEAFGPELYSVRDNSYSMDVTSKGFRAHKDNMIVMGGIFERLYTGLVLPGYSTAAAIDGSPQPTNDTIIRNINTGAMHFIRNEFLVRAE